MRYSAVLQVAALAVGCDDDIVGVAAPGAAAGVQLYSIEGVGGHVYYDTLAIDSATARFETVTCIANIEGTCESTNRSSGDVQDFELEKIFSRAQSPAFQKLKSEYRLSGAVPPDGGSSRLTITVGERRRVITWEKGVTLPDELSRFLCLLSQVRGSLALCAD